MEIKKRTTYALVLALVLVTSFYMLGSTSEDNNRESSADGIQAARTYIAAYNEADDSKRAAMISQSFHEDGLIYTPTRELNKAGLEDMTADFHKGYFMEIVGEVDSHHNYLSFRWKYSEKNGGECYSKKPVL